MNDHLIAGRLGLDAFPFWDMLVHPTRENVINGVIASGAGGAVVVGAIVVVVVLTRCRWWKPLWSDWLTSLDHKKIGIMYVVLALVMLGRAIVEAVIMRTHQALGLGGGFLTAEHWGQLFTTHGAIMVFFMAMPFLTGLINYVVPLQLGARDVSFPVLNSVSLGLTAAGAGLVMISLVFEPFSIGGWSGYPPFTENAFSPDVGPDYWIWAVTLGSLASTMSGINFAVTIYKERCPGMDLFRMPLFCWTALCTSILMIFAMPALTVATGLLALDRYADFHFFTNDLGGNMMNYANLFWLFGHPEVYILILPAFGVYSEVFSTFSGKRLYGYRTLVVATMCIAVLSFSVWLHHFFTMGQGADVNAFFGISTMLIAIPTGVKVYDWLLTMYRGRVRLSVPLVYALGFISLFVIGGMSGIILANPSLDYQVHNSLFLVAHFHNMLIPGTLFAMLGGTHYWFPKAFGYRLDDRWGYRAAGLWIVGFMLAFFPLYVLGALGMPRRSAAYYDPRFLPWTSVALVGALLVLCALVATLVQLWVSVRDRDLRRVPAGDPWDGRSLEWMTAAPPPEYNFATIPTVGERDAFMRMKEEGRAYGAPERYEDITMPADSALGPTLAVAGFVGAFGLVWHIWWAAIAGVALAIVATIARSFARKTTKVVPADEVRREHEAWLRAVRDVPPVTRADEQATSNLGRALPAPLGGA